MRLLNHDLQIIYVAVLYFVNVSYQNFVPPIISMPDPFYLEHLDEYLSVLNNVTGINKYLVTTDCRRSCTTNDRRICYHRFHMEFYSAMGVACGNCANGNINDCFNDQCVMADGVERGIKSINRQLPGPHIEACINDLIVVDVSNAMVGTAATLHWHGMLQAGTQYMDGVPYVTQCPIQFNTMFRYAYWAVNTGTHFWHSHTGHHKPDGHYGALTIRQPIHDDPNSDLYDVDDNVVLISDWNHDDSEMFSPGLPTRMPGILPENLLVNGKGKFTDHGVTSVTPYHLFHFKTGTRYLLRVINSASHTCPIVVSIEKHNMTVTATDGHSIEPVVVDSIVTYAGERYDIVVDAEQTEGTFWVMFKALGRCEPVQIKQFAMITYNQDPSIRYLPPAAAVPTYEEIPTGRIILNHPNITTANGYSILKMTDLVSADLDQSILSGEPDFRVYMSFSNRLVDYDTVFNGGDWHNFMNSAGKILLVGTMDHIATTFPPSPYLSQPENIDESTLCNYEETPARCANSSFCFCNHLKKLPLNAVIEMMLMDESTAPTNVNHPLHLHGHEFYVTDMAQGYNGSRLTKDSIQHWLDNGYELTRTVYKAPLKDTVSVPSNGYVVVRFRANNPGFWVMHCHFDPHMLVGMIMTFQVGEISDYPEPPLNFPKCGNFNYS